MTEATINGLGYMRRDQFHAEIGGKNCLVCGEYKLKRADLTYEVACAVRPGVAMDVALWDEFCATRCKNRGVDCKRFRDAREG